MFSHHHILLKYFPHCIYLQTPIHTARPKMHATCSVKMFQGLLLTRSLLSFVLLFVCLLFCLLSFVLYYLTVLFYLLSKLTEGTTFNHFSSFPFYLPLSNQFLWIWLKLIIQMESNSRKTPRLKGIMIKIRFKLLILHICASAHQTSHPWGSFLRSPLTKVYFPHYHLLIPCNFFYPLFIILLIFVIFH